MFRDLAGILGFFLEILCNPVFWAAIVLWILYAKKKTGGLKKGAIACTIVVIVVHLILIPVARCSMDYNQEEKKQVTITQKTETTQAASTTVDNMKQARINDFYKNLDDYFKYTDSLYLTKTKIDDDISYFSKKATETKKRDEVLIYLKLEKEKCEEGLEILSKMFVPEIAKKAHSYLLDYYMFMSLKLSHFISDLSGFSVNESDYWTLSDKTDNAFDKFMQELERMRISLENEGKKLGLYAE